MMPVLLLACASKEAPYSDCDPLVPDVCGLPWPSAQHIEEVDGGWRLDLGPETLPPHEEGPTVDPSAWNQRDGFSIQAPMLAWFDDLSAEGLPVDGGASLAEGSTVVVVDLGTGERVPVRAELSVDDNPTLVIHPTAGLAPGTWYAVGLQGLKTKNGSTVDPSESFLQLRDNTRADTWDIEGRRGQYEDEIFPALEAAGALRGNLQLAWHFRTASTENTTETALSMRDQAQAWQDEHGASWTWTDIESLDCETGTIGKHLEGTLSVPRFVDSEEAPAFLVLEDGQPVVQATQEIPFVVRVPCSLLDDPSDGLLVQYGHGLFQDRYEVEKDYLGELANQYGWVLIAADWQGMSRQDTLPIVQMMGGDMGDFGSIPQRTHQSWVNKDLLLRAATGPMRQDPELVVDGTPLTTGDPGFLGISMGAVIGGGYVAFSEQLDRAVLNVGGTPFAMLLPRSTNFPAFENILNAELGDPRAVQLALSAFQTLWDPAESAGWTPILKESDTLLLQHNLGDAQVSTLSGQRLARAVGAQLLAPETRTVWGLESVTSPTGSAYIEWSYSDASPEPTTAEPADPDTDTHFCSRQEPYAWEQMDTFFRNGEIQDTCQGPCQGIRGGFCDARPN
jgi:hypothetical protein